MKYFSLFTLLIILVSGNVYAQIEFPALFGDNMVLQQEFETPFWGWAEPGEDISIKGSWDHNNVQTTADKNGDWSLKLHTPEAGGPYFVTVNNDTLHNVMIGEVWICSGQSNMQWTLEQSMNDTDEIPLADFPDIRLFYVARNNSDTSYKNCYGDWKECTPGSARTFSAVAYYFGGMLSENANKTKGDHGSKFERPQILMIDGKPSCLYVPSGTNTDGG